MQFSNEMWGLKNFFLDMIKSIGYTTLCGFLSFSTKNIEKRKGPKGNKDDIFFGPAKWVNNEFQLYLYG